MKRKTIGDNPLDSLVPPVEAAAKASCGLGQSAPPPRVEKKARITVHLPVEVIQRVKAAVYWTPGLTLAALAEEAFTKAVDRLEKERGKPFEIRTGPLKTGRPIKLG